MRSSVSPRGRVAEAAGSGDAGRSPWGAPASGRAAAGTAVITMSARAAAGGRRVGTGSVARSARVDSARRAPAPPPRVGLRSPRRGDAARARRSSTRRPHAATSSARTGPVGPRPAAQAWAAPVTQQDVRGVEPAVHDAEVVQVGERRGHRGGDAADVGDGARPPRERLAGVGGAQLAGGGQGLLRSAQSPARGRDRTRASPPPGGGRRPGGRTRGAADRRRQPRWRS